MRICATILEVELGGSTPVADLYISVVIYSQICKYTKRTEGYLWKKTNQL